MNTKEIADWHTANANDDLKATSHYEIVAVDAYAALTREECVELIASLSRDKASVEHTLRNNEARYRLSSDADTLALIATQRRYFVALRTNIATLSISLHTSK